MNRHAMTSLCAKFPQFFWRGLRLCVLTSALISLVQSQDGTPQRRFAVPATWEDKVMNGVEVPLANPIGSPKHVPADYYYRIRYGRFTSNTRYMLPAASPPVTWRN
jgi:hypothetical protein